MCTSTHWINATRWLVETLPDPPLPAFSSFSSAPGVFCRIPPLGHFIRRHGSTPLVMPELIYRLFAATIVSCMAHDTVRLTAGRELSTTITKTNTPATCFRPYVAR